MRDDRPILSYAKEERRYPLFTVALYLVVLVWLILCVLGIVNAIRR